MLAEHPLDILKNLQKRALTLTKRHNTLTKYERYKSTWNRNATNAPFWTCYQCSAQGAEAARATAASSAPAALAAAAPAASAASSAPSSAHGDFCKHKQVRSTFTSYVIRLMQYVTFHNKECAQSLFSIGSKPDTCFCPQTCVLQS